MNITPKDAAGTVAPVIQDKQPDTISSPQTSAAPEATKPDEVLSPKFAALARKEKALRAERMKIEAERRAIESQRGDFDKANAWKQKLTQDPYGVMLEAGLTADQVASLMLNQPNPGDQKLTLIEQELRATKEELQRLKSGQEDSANQGREAARKQIHHDIKSFVAADESFEAIKQYGEPAELAVVQLIEKTFDEEGYVMDTEEAIRAVEDELIEEAFKATKLKKVLARLNPPPAPAAEEPKQLQQTQKPQINTLSNRMSQSTAKPLSDRERRERAILAFQGKLS